MRDENTQELPSDETAAERPEVGSPTVRCSRCSTGVIAHERFCSACNSPWCSRCKTYVQANASGDHCSRCGGFVVANAASTTPRREQLSQAQQAVYDETLERRYRDHGGRYAINPLDIWRFELDAALAAQLWDAIRRLVKAEPASEEGKQLVSAAEKLAAARDRLALQFEKPVAVRPVLSESSGQAPLPVDVQEQVRRLLDQAERLLRGESAVSGPRTGTPAVGAPAPLTNEADPDPTTDPEPAHCLGRPAGFPPESEAPADDLPDRALLARDPATWRVLYGNHPSEVARRREEATRTMMARLGQPSPLGKRR